MGLKPDDLDDINDHMKLMTEKFKPSQAYHLCQETIKMIQHTINMLESMDEIGFEQLKDANVIMIITMLQVFAARNKDSIEKLLSIPIDNIEGILDRHYT